MTENEARQMEVEIKWNGRANVCVHCGKVPETYYITTGHDHTDDSIRYCFCRSVAPSIEQLTARIERLNYSLAQEIALSDRLKVASRMPGTGNYVEWIETIRNSHDQAEQLTARVRELAAEVERLSAAHVKACQANADSQAELTAAQEEIERLNGQISVYRLSFVELERQRDVEMTSATRRRAIEQQATTGGFERSTVHNGRNLARRD